MPVKIQVDKFGRRNRRFLALLKNATPVGAGMIAGFERFRGELIKSGGPLNIGGRASPTSPDGLRVITGNLRRSVTVLRPEKRGDTTRAGLRFGAPYSSRWIGNKKVAGRKVGINEEFKNFLPTYRKIFEQVFVREMRKAERADG